MIIIAYPDDTNGNISSFHVFFMKSTSIDTYLTKRIDKLHGNKICFSISPSATVVKNNLSISLR